MGGCAAPGSAGSVGGWPRNGGTGLGLDSGEAGNCCLGDGGIGSSCDGSSFGRAPAGSASGGTIVSSVALAVLGALKRARKRNGTTPIRPARMFST
jgi:hypothetical protein